MFLQPCVLPYFAHLAVPCVPEPYVSCRVCAPKAPRGSEIQVPGELRTPLSGCEAQRVPAEELGVGSAVCTGSRGGGAGGETELQ